MLHPIVLYVDQPWDQRAKCVGGQKNADFKFEHDEDNPDLNCNEKLMNFFIINIYLHFQWKPSYTF